MVDVGQIRAAEQAIQAVSPPDATRAKLQIALLKKVLESQQDQAAELMRMQEGKGQVLDIRV